MEEAVNNRKTVKDYRVKGCPFHSKSSTVLGSTNNRFLLNTLNGGNATNTVNLLNA